MISFKSGGFSGTGTTPMRGVRAQHKMAVARLRLALQVKAATQRQRLTLGVVWRCLLLDFLEFLDFLECLEFLEFLEFLELFLNGRIDNTMVPINTNTFFRCRSIFAARPRRCPNSGTRDQRLDSGKSED